ncbi:hypothetical protein EQ500_04310 [Lactobacillus sp. XV13L]|nr:hypothetical protein [Lactobacillus sp. XV13L]
MSDPGINVFPDNQEVTLQQKNWPDSYSNITNYQRIHLIIPKPNINNVVKPGKYHAVLTYNIVNAL